MNKHQLESSLRGVRLLIGHMREEGESLDTAIAASDFDAATTMVEPLINVAAILTRQLKAALISDVSTALSNARRFMRSEFDECWLAASQMVEKIIAGDLPRFIEGNAGVVGLGSQEIARGAAMALAEISGEHPNAVVARLRRQLREQGEAVQLSDRDGINANMTQYANDPTITQNRIDTAIALFKAIHQAGVDLHNRAVDFHEEGKVEAHDCYAGVSLITITAAALSAGTIQLIQANNHYPAFALIRQLVETEFVLWKFQRDPSSIPSWLNSDKEAREQNWKPSRIYRDGDNDYRQKDYSRHCEMGGHPTPIGTRIASGERHPRVEASALGDLILHLRDSYDHILVAADALDAKYSQENPTIGTAIRSEIQDATNLWSQMDNYAFSTTYFSDPID